MLEILWVFPFLFLPFLYNFFRNYRFVQLYSISCLAVLVSLCLMVGRVSRLNSRHTQQLSAVWISHRMARACAVRLMIRPSRWDMHSRTYIPVIKVSLTHLPVVTLILSIQTTAVYILLRTTSACPPRRFLFQFPSGDITVQRLVQSVPSLNMGQLLVQTVSICSSPSHGWPLPVTRALKWRSTS